LAALELLELSAMSAGLDALLAWPGRPAGLLWPGRRAALATSGPQNASQRQTTRENSTSRPQAQASTTSKTTFSLERYCEFGISDVSAPDASSELRNAPQTAHGAPRRGSKTASGAPRGPPRAPEVASKSPWELPESLQERSARPKSATRGLEEAPRPPRGPSHERFGGCRSAKRGFPELLSGTLQSSFQELLHRPLGACCVVAARRS